MAGTVEQQCAGGGVERLSEASEQTYVGTRRYVRRQRSWFRRDHRVQWLNPDGAGRTDLIDGVVRAWRASRV